MFTWQGRRDQDAVFVFENTEHAAATEELVPAAAGQVSEKDDVQRSGEFS